MPSGRGLCRKHMMFLFDKASIFFGNQRCGNTVLFSYIFA